MNLKTFHKEAFTTKLQRGVLRRSAAHERPLGAEDSLPQTVDFSELREGSGRYHQAKSTWEMS